MKSRIIEEMGYTPLTIPKTGVFPLTLLEQTGDNVFQKLFSKKKKALLVADDIFSLFPLKPKQGTTLKSGTPERLPNLKCYSLVDSKKLMNANLKTATKEIAQMVTNANQKKSGKLLFTFKNVTSIQVHTIIILEKHLNITPVVKNAPGFLKKLKQKKLFIITEVLQAEEFSIEDANDFNFQGQLQAKSINDYLKARVQSANNKQSGTQLTYKDPALPITFAIKAHAIYPRNEKDMTGYSVFPVALKSVRSNVGLRNDIKPDASIA